MIKVNREGNQTEMPAVYYVTGSGLFPVPRERLGDVSTLKEEFHASESKRAIMLVMARRI